MEPSFLAGCRTDGAPRAVLSEVLDPKAKDRLRRGAAESHTSRPQGQTGTCTQTGPLGRGWSPLFEKLQQTFRGLLLELLLCRILGALTFLRRDPELLGDLGIRLLLEILLRRIDLVA